MKADKRDLLNDVQRHHPKTVTVEINGDSLGAKDIDSPSPLSCYLLLTGAMKAQQSKED
jgi:hypothetical protein